MEHDVPQQAVDHLREYIAAVCSVFFADESTGSDDGFTAFDGIGAKSTADQLAQFLREDEQARLLQRFIANGSHAALIVQKNLASKPAVPSGDGELEADAPKAASSSTGTEKEGEEVECDNTARESVDGKGSQIDSSILCSLR